MALKSFFTTLPIPEHGKNSQKPLSVYSRYLGRLYHIVSIVFILMLVAVFG